MIKNLFNKLANKLILQQQEIQNAQIDLYEKDENGKNINYRNTKSFGNYGCPFQQVFYGKSLAIWDYFLLTYTKPDNARTKGRFSLTDDAMKLLMPGVSESPSFYFNPFNEKHFKGYLTDGTELLVEKCTRIGWTSDKLNNLEYKLIYLGQIGNYKERNDINNYKVIETSEHHHYGIAWDDPKIDLSELLPDFNTYSAAFKDYLMKYTCPYADKSGKFCKNTFRFLPIAKQVLNAELGVKWTINYKLAEYNSMGHIVTGKNSRYGRINSFLVAISYKRDILNFSSGGSKDVNAYIISVTGKQPQSENEIKIIQFDKMKDFLADQTTY